MDHIHPAVVKRQAIPRTPKLRGPVRLDLRLLEWPQRHEIMEVFREAQRMSRSGYVQRRPANEPPDDIA
jgi:hypothetical protein